MVGPEVVDNMARSFESSGGKALAERILDAMDAGLAGGGDRRGQQSAALFIVKKLAGAGGYSDVSEDLRVNDHARPLTELRRLLTVRQSGEIIASANRSFESGDREQGLRRLLELRERIPDNDNVWIALGSLYLKMNRKADALNAVRRAVELNPSNKRKGSGGLPRHPSFEALRADPEWLRIMTP
jgi:tetratricopeptide (TPR) repeat protein